MNKRLIWILLVLFLIGSGGMIEAQVVKKTIKNTPVVIEEEDSEEEEEEDEDYDEEDEGEGDLDEEEDDVPTVLGEDEIAVTDKEGNEELIEFPEAMTYDLDSLLNLYMSRTYLTGTNDCEMKDVNPTYPREVYIERLSRIPSVMELAYNDVVQKFIDRYAGRLRYSVSYMLGAMNFYMPVFEEALEAYQLPLELKYLPIIESALNPKVGDWNLVIAAYNCGPENINKAIRRARAAKGKAQEGDALTPEDKDYWHIYPYLPAETRGYVPAFIAANYIMTYYCDHNICPMTTRLPAQTDTIVVRRNVHLEQVAAVLGIDIDMLRSLNPEYRRDIVPGLTKPSAIRLPLADAGRFIDNEDSIYNYRTDELLNKRLEVTINDDVPTYTRKATKKVTRKNSRARRNSRVTRNKRTSARKTTARKRTTARKKVTAKKKAPAKKKTTAKRSRRRR